MVPPPIKPNIMTMTTTAITFLLFFRNHLTKFIYLLHNWLNGDWLIGDWLIG